MPTFTEEMIEAAITGFEAQKQRIDEQIAELRAMLPSSTSIRAYVAPSTGPKKHTMSAAGRQAIAEAQRKRWAAAKGEALAPKAAKKPKRKLSTAGRAAIVAALKKRWAAKRAASKKAA
jgi:cell division septum initiation protein DivIVA